ncbi:MAG TPA: MarR family transcriptional regulator [Terriglobales bacterium]|nr:MarR family transcriptional regulator [Terriglobales bacterium]
MVQKAKTVHEEIRQTRPFRSVAEETILTLYRTVDALQRDFAKLIEPEGISTQQYNVLRILRGAGAEGLPTLEIADRMVERTPGITRLLDKLEAKQLVRRKRCPEDRRQVLCYISEGGLKLLARLDRPLTDVGLRSMKPLTDPQMRQMIEFLNQVRAGLG